MIDHDWRNPDYEPIWAERGRRLQLILDTDGMAKGLKEHYKHNPVDFICDWGVTFDPRNAEIGLPVTIPFALFDKQKEFIDWTKDRWQGREDGLAEKSRDMGVSWLCVAFSVWMWLFWPGTVVGFGSRKEEYVDKLGDPKSLFWKIRVFIDYLPPIFRPVGFNRNEHTPHMRIINPENGAAIVGEAGDNIGRGNRTSIYFKDESAFYERPDAIDAALSQTSNCKIDVSTPNGNGNPFYKKRHSGKIKVFTFHWRDDPRKDADWYQKQKDTLDPVIVAQEIDIDYNASTSDAYIEGELVASAQNLGPADVSPIGGFCVGIDAAHFGDDESVVTVRRGSLTLPQRSFRKLDGPELAASVEQMLDEIIQVNHGEVAYIVIELDGPGVSCYDALRRGRYADKVAGVHTGARQSDHVNYNLRSLMWRRAKDYLEVGGRSMPNDTELKSQLCSVKYKYKEGLLLMQSKKEYKAEFGKSPDRADSWVLTFAVQDAPKSGPLRRGLKMV